MAKHIPTGLRLRTSAVTNRSRIGHIAYGIPPVHVHTSAQFAARLTLPFWRTSSVCDSGESDNHQSTHGGKSKTTETAVVEKPAEEEEHAGHHHGHAH